MKLRWLRRHAVVRTLVSAGILAGIALAVAPVAFERSEGDGLRAFVVASTQGPLSTCARTLHLADHGVRVHLRLERQPHRQHA